MTVTVVSLTAFRSLYGIKTLQQNEKNKNRHGAWLFSFRKNLLNRRMQRRVDEFGNPILDEDYALPSIPGATMTGIRSIIFRMTARTTEVFSGRGDLASIDESQKKEEPGSINAVGDSDVHQYAKSYA